MKKRSPKSTPKERDDRARWQRNWRATRAEKSITIHLDADDAATLDAIAIGLFVYEPHDAEAPTSVYRPSKAQAVRLLCHWWRRTHGYDSEGFASVELNTIMKLRDQLADFWRHETSRRQQQHDQCEPSSDPPWPKNLGLLLSHVVSKMM